MINIAVSANYEGYPAVGSNGSAFLVLWADGRNDPGNLSAPLDIYGARVSSAGVLQDTSGFVLSSSGNGEGEAAVASDGTNYLVVWSDQRGGDRDIYGIRVSGAGAVLDSAAFAISSETRDQRYPAVAFDGTNYLVAWQDDRSGNSDIYAGRVTPSGTVLDSSGIVVCDDASYQVTPRVASNGSNSLVVWEDRRYYGDVYGARVSTSGALLDASGIVISSGASYERTPAVASLGSNYLVVWQDYRSSSRYEVYGARVSGAGALLDASGIQIATGSYSAYYPAVAADSSNYLVVWNGGSYANYNIYGRRVSSSGALLDAGQITITSASGNQQRATLSSDGSQHLVVYQDARSGGADIYGARVSAAGVVLDVTDFSITATSTEEELPVVAAQGSGKWLVAYQHYVSGSPYACDRVVVRLVNSTTGTNPLGGSCSLGSDCQSGWCSDSVCCNSACGNSAPDDCQACNASGICSTLSGTTCRAAAGVCDQAETCTGASASCPANTFKSSSVTCRAATGECDLPEQCSGAGANCTANTYVTNGTPCASGGGICWGGTCWLNSDAGIPDLGPDSGPDSGPTPGPDKGIYVLVDLGRDAAREADAAAGHDAKVDGRPAVDSTAARDAAPPAPDGAAADGARQRRDPTGTVLEGGCGCQTASSPSAAGLQLILLALGLTLLGRRRRRRRGARRQG